jgi:hypothetical protein
MSVLDRASLRALPRQRGRHVSLKAVERAGLRSVRRMSHGEAVVPHFLRDGAHGRFERTLSGLTAFSALVTTAEVYIEHYRASFGNKMMWAPVVVTPPVVVAGIAGVYSKKWAKTALPASAAAYTAVGLIGQYYHVRGVSRRPGGWRLASYNVPMGPPIVAPGLMSIVGGMGLLAAVLRRED